MDVFELSLALNESIRTSPTYLQMKMAEKAMLGDEEVARLIVLFQTAQDDYNFAQRFSLESLSSCQSNLARAKQQLDEHPLVKQYQLHFNLIKAILRDISHDLFDEYKTPSSGSSCGTKK